MSSFIHGGHGPNTLREPDDVYVLTIPGFTWLRVPFPHQTTRVLHNCEVAGGRQLILVGGLAPNNDGNADLGWRSPDPWTQNIGVYDMAALKWKDRYDSGAPNYETLGLIKQWYARGLVIGLYIHVELYSLVRIAVAKGRSNGNPNN